MITTNKNLSDKTLPRILLAAPSSQSGKTIITCGLLQVLKNRGLASSAWKCGPDYIDPMFHKYVLGITGGNLDSFFSDENQIKSQLVQAAANSRISVIEGVMGYYDGIGGTDTSASSYEIARITKTPVILVVDGRGASLSIAAVVKGFLEYREYSWIQGVILNRVSEALYLRLKPLIEELGVVLVGYLPECKEADLKSRHLGLIMPNEVEGFQKALQSLADKMEQTIDIELLLSLADQAFPLELGKNGETALYGRKKDSHPVLIGVARDEAFCFYYQENLKLLRQLGAELVEFSPLRDKKLPDKIQGLLLGGGYPEVHARELSENQEMRQAVYQAVTSGMPILAECGGFLYLHGTLEGMDGICYPMAGVITEQAFRTKKLSHFGYISLRRRKPSRDFCQNDWIKGHEFHYWHSTGEGKDFYAQKPQSSRGWECIHEKGGMIAGFPHLYYPSNPGVLADWLDLCRTYGRSER